ncbi:MAG: deoxyguanosinetriphosphate triphosphohydrolase [Deltaproteobacteria bacterium]|nr:deoxyguanosinetriphosphate triphosphohydrolase [Deltaproteobacteria bacterium]
MSIRESFENREKNFISKYGCLSSKSKGRLRNEGLCEIRTIFQQDRDRILYSNAFRRLKYKTQVFLSPLGDEYRTRLTHTLEVAQIARTIARALYLNEDLAEAIALGHDLGHTPFGHGGETVLKELVPGGFTHNQQSIRIVDLLEKNGKGLNLSLEVRDGILKHSKGTGDIMPDDPEETAYTLEGKVVRIADIMAYLNHDLDDAIRSGVIVRGQIPKECVKVLGNSNAERIGAMIQDLIYSSRISEGKFYLHMSDKVHSAMLLLRRFLYENVYRSYKVHKEFIKAKKILSELYFYFLENGKQLKSHLAVMKISDCYDENTPKERIVCDFIACMTDRYALNLYARLFFPSPLV